MNKYIILLILLLIVIIFYFTYYYDKTNIEKFGNPPTDSVIILLANNYLEQEEKDSISIKKRDGVNTGIVMNNGIMSIGSNFSFDPSNNNLKCGNFNIDKDGKINDKYNVAINVNTDANGNILVNDFVYNNNSKELIKSDRTIKIDQSGNIFLGQIKYNKSGYLSKIDKDDKESYIFDPSGNVNLGEYFYSANGTITKSDKSITIDSSGNIDTLDYTLNLNNKDFKNKDINIPLTISNGVAKCGDLFELNSKSSDGQKIKFFNNNYYFNNGILRNENNTISIDSESINMNSNKYKYNLASKVLSGNDTQINKFIIEAPPSNSIKLGKTSQITYNSDGTGKFI